MSMYTKTVDIDKVKKMYFAEGKSAQDIADDYGKTVWQIYRFMRKHSLIRRTSAQTIRLKFEKSPLSFNEIKNKSKLERELHLAGLMLYWAEGTKLDMHVVDFANSNEVMVKVFLRTLRMIYRVSETRLRVLVYCYANQNPRALIKYWSDLLEIPISQFSKPYVRQDFNPEKVGKMKKGLVHIRYADRRLKEKIMRDIDKISRQLSWDGGVVKHTSL